MAEILHYQKSQSLAHTHTHTVFSGKIWTFSKWLFHTWCFGATFLFAIGESQGRKTLLGDGQLMCEVIEASDVVDAVLDHHAGQLIIHLLASSEINRHLTFV